MYASEIYKFLSKHILDANANIIVTSIDMLPSNPRFPLYCVVNEDVSTGPGTHWMCLFIDNKKHGIFLDSFARMPQPEIENFLVRHTISFEINRIQLQMTTSTDCGKFCAVGLVEFYRNKSLKHFLCNFSPVNRYLNHLIIENMFVNDCLNKL